jgi:hypothetical protein
MEAVVSSETLVNTSKITRRINPENERMKKFPAFYGTQDLTAFSCCMRVKLIYLNMLPSSFGETGCNIDCLNIVTLQAEK